MAKKNQPKTRSEIAEDKRHDIKYECVALVGLIDDQMTRINYNREITRPEVTTDELQTIRASLVKESVYGHGDS